MLAPLKAVVSKLQQMEHFTALERNGRGYQEKWTLGTETNTNNWIIIIGPWDHAYTYTNLRLLILLKYMRLVIFYVY